jgi:hypothetical protein
MRMVRSGVAAFVLVLALASGGVLPAEAQTAAVTLNDAAWIGSAQLPDGALATYPDRQFISPYIANLAALGLARATAATGSPAPAQAAWGWLFWYQAHMDLSGFVTDYAVRNGVAVSTGDMDSTDAYAGTFLLAVGEVFRTTGDRKRVNALHDGIVRAVAAIEATQDADGLTWAKPTWKVKYLMDQAEVYAGLKAASDLGLAMGDGPLTQRASADAARVQTGVSSLWNPSTGAFDWAVHADGTRTSTNWAIFYPDALEQAWPVAFGLIDGEPAASIMTQFAAHQPQWAQPGMVAQYSDAIRTVGYWAPVGWAFARVGRTDLAGAGAATIRAAADAVNRAWPFNSADAGELIVLDQPLTPSAPTRQKNRARS